MEKVIGPLIEEDRKARETGNRRSRYLRGHQQRLIYVCRSGENAIVTALGFHK